MGCIFSCNSSQPLDCVRVIHINGYVEDFDAPVTVGDVTGKPPRQVLCTSAQLLSFYSLQFRADEPLEPGRVYFLLPNSVLQSESSPVDLACLMTRLTSIAKRGGPASPCPVPGRGTSLSSSASPVEALLGRFDGSPARQTGGTCGGMGSRARTWRPQLDRIDERSFGRSLGRESINSNASG